MMESNAEIVGLLESNELKELEQAPLSQIFSDGGEVVVVSDLHMSEGMKSGGAYGGTENFFADDSFRRFLSFLSVRLRAKGDKRALLVINGDFIDFLRVVSVPQGEAEYQEWESMLRDIGITDKTVSVLKASVSKKERDLGLKTHDYKSLWKLDRVVKGHGPVFDALAGWISDGHSLLILKGNHDLEWHWPAVRRYFRLVLARRIKAADPAESLGECLAAVDSHFTYVHNACVIDGEIYIEHGDRYDKFTRVLGPPVWGEKGEELNIPFGSFINRYLINRLELVYPFLDNIRPSQNILHVLMRERFFLGVKVLFYYLPFTIRMIPKRYAQFMFKPVLSYLAAVGLPLVLLIVMWWGRLSSVLSNAAPPAAPGIADIVSQYAVGFLKDSGVLFLGYLFSRFVSYFQLEEPGFLLEPATRILAEHSGYRLVTMGHTHNPESYQENGRWYINTSTWIPVIESSSASLRADKTYAVLHVERGAAGELVIRPLQRWNDDAGRLDPMTIVTQK